MERISPKNYTLTFEPNFKSFTFLGKEKIRFELLRRTKYILLKAVELKILDCSLAQSDKGKVTSFETDERKELVKINFSRELEKGTYDLNIDFEGILNDKLSGFYRSKYTNTARPVGEEKYLATSQFEATDAHRAFPCIDNPAYKATFDVTLVVDKGLQAVSNTLPIEEKLVGGKRAVRFATSPLMSTYLLYLGVGEFEWITSKYKDVLVRVVTTPGKKTYGRFALEFAKKCLAYYEEYFAEPYPLNKLDLIAIPDFSAGAMENWGAITFRENALLYYPGKTSKASMQRTAEFIAHEITHQWFGNLVTMKWWDDLWLNESFATYMAYKALDYYFPEWDIMTSYMDEVYSGMGLDSLKTSHPIKVHVKNTSEIDELFDEITYRKGGGVLKMLEGYLDENTFRDGLRAYISAFKYKNAEAKDLWESLENAAKKPVIVIMQKFITQTGFPLVEAEFNNGKLMLRQERFLLENKSSEKTLWNIPLVVQYDAERVHRHVFRAKEEELTFSEPVKFININFDADGFFITKYGKEELAALKSNLKHVNNKNRLSLEHDLFNLLLSEYMDLNEYLDQIEEFCRYEKDPHVLSDVIGDLSMIYRLLGNAKAKDLLLKFSQLGMGICGYVPKKSENPPFVILRELSISRLVRLGDKESSAFVLRKFKKYLANETSLEPDLRSVVFSYAVWLDEMNYSIVLDKFMSADVQEEKIKFLRALGFAQRSELIKKTLSFALSKEVRFADVLYVVNAVAGNPKASETVFRWLIKEWGGLMKRSGGLGGIMLKRYLQYVIPVCGVGREKEVEDFFKKANTKGLERAVSQVMEELRINSRFTGKYKTSLPIL